MSAAHQVLDAAWRAAPDGLVGAVSVAFEPSGASRRPLRLERLRCDGALAARLTPDGLYLVGAGAHPIGNDRLRVELDLGIACELTVRSSAATIARPGATAGTSSMTTLARVARDATLCWLVEPGVAVSGARHESDSRVELAPSARLCWRDEMVLGRHDEVVPGSWQSRLEVRRSGRALFVGAIAAGPAHVAWGSPAVLNGARAVVSLLVVDPQRPDGEGRQPWRRRTAEGDRARGGVFPLAGAAVEIVAFGDDLVACRHIVAELVASLDCPWLPPALTDSGVTTAMSGAS